MAVTRVHVGAGNGFDDGCGEFAGGEDFLVPALEPLIFFSRDDHSAVTPVASDDHRLGQGGVLKASDFLAEFCRSYADHMHYF